ncbi:MAG: cytochrome c maturation protein CcmE [Acidobacteriota bacterium]
MNKRKIKFLVGSLIIVGSVAWLGFSGFDESLAYYKTVDELMAMNQDAYGKRVRVAGDVVAGSIQTAGGRLQSFVLEQEGKTLRINYVGNELPPDTFKDGSQALAEGHLNPNGEFEAAKIQAKCASKYEAQYKLEDKSK